MCLGLEEGLKRKHLQEKKNAQELTSCELLFCDMKVLREKKSVHEKGDTRTGLNAIPRAAECDEIRDWTAWIDNCSDDGGQDFCSCAAALRCRCSGDRHADEGLGSADACTDACTDACANIGSKHGHPQPAG